MLIGVDSDFKGKAMKQMSEIKVAVLTGGIGEERSISLESGRNVAKALSESGVRVKAADITPSNMKILDDESIDVFFIAMHGKFGEDGQLQSILEERLLVYTGSGSIASRLAFDKMASKEAFARAGVKVPKAVLLDGETDASTLKKVIGREAGDKFVVKPLRQGSSVGVEIVCGIEETIEAGCRCMDKFGDCMIEEFIEGREITVGILCGRVLPIIEIRTKNSFYDYQAKYVDDKTQFLFDTIEDAELKKSVERTAMKCFRSLGCKHFGRVDFIIGRDGVAMPLEINTIPGFTSHSLLPMAAARTGLSMSQLCFKIIETALHEHETSVRA